MRLVTIDSRDLGGRPGLWLPDDEILDLVAAPGSMRATRRLPSSVVSILAEGDEGRQRLTRLADEIAAASANERGAWRENGVLLPAAGTSLLAPIRRPGLILVIDGDGQAALKNPNAVTGPGGALVIPAMARDRLAVRFALGAVLGRSLYSATEQQASQAIAAWTLLIEFGTTGDEGGFSGGQFPGACPLGPALLTVDSTAADSMVLAATVNGHELYRGSAVPGNADPAAIIARLSGAYGFRPGDIVALPAQLPRKRPLQVQPGDRLRLMLAEELSLTVNVQASPGS